MDWNAVGAIGQLLSAAVLAFALVQVRQARKDARRAVVKKLRISVLVLASVPLVFPATASATLIQQDLFTAGDDLVTYDTNTHLQWLDLNQSLNLSFNEVTDGTRYWNGLGFAVAVVNQVEELFLDAGFVSSGSGQFAVTLAQAQAFIGLLSATAIAP